MTPTAFPSLPVRFTAAARKLAVAALFAALVLAALVPFLHVRAQEAVSLNTLTVDLWPEFDRPSMLVMYQFSLSDQFKVPGEVRLRIPADAGEPNAVAVCEPTGNCFNTPFTTEPAGDWTVLVISATMPDVRVEYYDPGLTMDGANRHYEFIWPGDFAVSAFRLHVQQPSGAREMRLKPGTVTQSVEGDGLTYYTLEVGALPAGQQVAVDVDYVKDTDTLTNTGMPVAPIEPLNTQPGKLNVSSLAPLILGIVGVALILGGGLWYWYSGRQRSAQKEPRRRKRKTAQPAAAEGDPGPVYCHQCGNRAASGDRFCRTCGATLRRG